MILDTSFLVDIMENDARAVEKLQDMIKEGEPTLVSAVSIFELFTGLARSKRPVEEKNKIINVLEEQTILPFERASAEKGGEIDGTLIKEGKMISVTDCMIAGAALTHNEKVLTRNTKDFNRVRGLKTESY